MKTLITGAQVINEGWIVEKDVLVEDEFISALLPSGSLVSADQVIEASGKYLLPGVIDDQVHFREPGLTHKGELYTESRAAVAGGVTSFMEMPNTLPQTITQELLEEKFRRAAKVSPANFSFYMGATNDNLEELLKTNPRNTCGIKVFMGASTGNMLVDHPETLRAIFAKAPTLVAVHCEDETTIRENTTHYRGQYGEDIPVQFHPAIRSAEACYLSSSLAVSLAREYGTRLHVLHLSTDRELELFETGRPIEEKRITAEVCVHHLWFTDADYAVRGNLIKWNPAIKTAADREALWRALNEDRLDVVATDHAPHTLEEKRNPYTSCPSGAPMVQHSLVAMLEMSRQGRISLEKVVEKMCHAPARLFRIDRRGYIREGYFADLVLVNPAAPWTVSRENILYKCGWSPLDGVAFSHRVTHTWVNGHLVWNNGRLDDSRLGMRLNFNI
ncbi:MAG: dihydroorotase [Bacteroidales bacterium]